MDPKLAHGEGLGLCLGDVLWHITAAVLASISPRIWRVWRPDIGACVKSGPLGRPARRLGLAPTEDHGQTQGQQAGSG